MFKLGFLSRQLRNNPSREQLAHLGVQSVDRVDVRDIAPHEHAVLVQRNQLSQRRGRGPAEQNRVERAVFLKRTMPRECSVSSLMRLLRIIETDANSIEPEAFATL